MSVTAVGQRPQASRSAPVLEARTTTSWPASVSRRDTSAGCPVVVDDEESLARARNLSA
jgi:hypothetical protein